MTYMDPKFLDRSRTVFAENSRQSLADVCALVDAEFTGTRRRDLLSGLNTLARVMDIELSHIRATPKAVRTLLTSRAAAELGLTERRWRNIRSSVVSAVRKFGAVPSNITQRALINAEWTDLLGRVIAKHHRHGLARLARFCSAMAISPEAVDRATLLGFYEALVAEDLVWNPRTKLKHTIAVWNICHRQAPDWPDIRLASPFERDVITFPLEHFPDSFRVDLEAWCARLLSPDPMDPSAPPRPVKAITVNAKTALVLRFASALVRRKVLPIEEVTDLRVLVTDVERFKGGLRYFLDRFEGQSNAYIANIADTLRAIAKHYVEVPGEVYEAIESICRRLRPPRNDGLKAKNRERLRQFDDPKNVARLLTFPQEEAERGRKLTNPYRAAKCYERAVTVSLLIATCLRIQNLRTIRLDIDLSRSGGRCFLSIPGERVKNGMNLDFELPADTAALIDEYLRTHRPHLRGAEGPYLFPGRDGGPRPYTTISQDIETSLRKRAGLTMNAHLFRHATAKIVIERDPGLAFVLSRHLGHKTINMTMQAYLGTEGRAAARSIDRVIKAAMADPGLPEV
jgi:integrase